MLSSIFGNFFLSKKICCFRVLFFLTACIILFFLFFEYFYEYQICSVCRIQQAIYYDLLIIFICLCISVIRIMAFILLLLLYAFGFFISFYQIGLEQHWWLVPSLCKYDLVSSFSLYSTLSVCNTIKWSIFGLSLAFFNLLLSLLFFSFVCIKLDF